MTIRREYRSTRYVHDKIERVLAEYPFTHMKLNDDGNMLFKRWLVTRDLKVEVSYISEEDSLRIYMQPRYDDKYENQSLIYEGTLLTVPNDDALLIMVRERITWEDVS